MLHESEVDRSLIRAFAQWSLDQPLPVVGRQSSPSENVVLAVTEALLTRGSTPLCSPVTEKALEAQEPRIVGALVDAMRAIAATPTFEYTPLSLGSDEERSLFDWAKALTADNRLGWSIVPQISLASLSPYANPSAAERGDLVFTHWDPSIRPVLVEVDGLQHGAHQGRDAARDDVLARAGIMVERVPANEARGQSGPRLNQLRQYLLGGLRAPMADHLVVRSLRRAKFIHQVQIAVLAAIRGGWLVLDGEWRIGIAVPALLRDDPTIGKLADVAVAELVELLTRVAAVHGQGGIRARPSIHLLDGTTVPVDVDVIVGPSDGSADSHDQRVPRFLIADAYLPIDVRAPVIAAPPSYPEAPSREDVRWLLHYLFRKADFWEGQWESIERTLQGKDSVVLLPTGGGKSIAFQLSALLLPGRCIVVDPIISLIDDQLDNLGKVGIDRAIGISSGLSTDERERALEAFQAGHYLFCYVAPERFQTPNFRKSVQALTAGTPVSVISIDEAHCVSEWGHDFRTAYLNVGRIAREYCHSGGRSPPLIALTGTASRIVLRDVQRELGITDFEAIITPRTFDRPELRFSVLSCRSDEKRGRVEGVLARLPSDFRLNQATFFQARGQHTHAGLVFCPHVNGKYGVDEYAKQLSRTFGMPVGQYSGGAPRGRKGEDWQRQKQETAAEFKRDRLSLLACTKAFGMGIDKPNVRYTVHICLPGSIESFYQEAGRAGRDRQRAECAIILSNDDPRRAKRLLSADIPVEELGRIVDETPWDDADDVVRALFFHVKAFRGIPKEIEDVSRLLSALEDAERRRNVNISWRSLGTRKWSASSSSPDEEEGRQRWEKALHRLVVLGVVEDYTVDFSGGVFGVRLAGASQEDIAAAFGRYAGAYQRRLGEEAEHDALRLRQQPYDAFVLAVAKKLIEFIYEHVELARRSSINEMLEAATVASKGGDIRGRILEYLQQSEWDNRLEAVRNSGHGGLDLIGQIMHDVVSPGDAAGLRGAVARALASYPDIPALLILRGTSEVLCQDAQLETAEDSIRAAVGHALGRYRLARVEVAEAIGDAITVVHERGGPAMALVKAVLRSRDVDRDLVRSLIAALPRELAGPAAQWLNDRLAERSTHMRSNSGE